MRRLLGLALMILGSAALAFGATSSEPLTLKQALSTALSSGPGIRAAALTFENATSALKSATAKDRFSLGATTGYTHQGQIGSSTTTSFGSPASSAPGESAQGGLSLSGPSTTASVKGSYGIADSTNSTGSHSQLATVSVNLSQTVFDGYPGGRAKASFQQAQFTYQLAQVSYDSARQTALYNVEQAYYTMLGAQQTVNLREITLKQSQQDLARTNAYFKANQLTSLDVLTSKIAEQTAQANLTSAQNALEQARSSLALLLGWPIDRQFSVAAISDPSVPSISEQQAVQTALSDRAEIKQARIHREEGAVGLRSSQSQRMPVVAVNGGASYTLYPGATSSTSAGSWNAGVSVSLPLFDSGLVSAQIAQSKNNLDQIALQEEQTKQNITIDVRKSLFAVKDASTRLDLAKESVKQAQGEYDLQKTKFTAGLSSNLDVINASVSLANAQVSLETARTNLNLAILNLQKAMGTLSSKS